MSDHVNSEKQRLLDLLSDRALFGLSQEEEQELDTLAASHPDVDATDMDRIVGLLEASSPGSDQPAMPAELQATILKSSVSDPNKSVVSNASTSDITPQVVKQKNAGSNLSNPWMWLALAATAASLLFAFSAAYWPDGNEPTLSIAARRTQLKTNATDLQQVEWTSTNPKLEYSGDVIWSNNEQLGFMTFRGLPVNDPTKEQYQLWIFDTEQDERYPIDGGVFDVTGSSVTVPIDAKIRVSKPSMFAITIEKPGGVVVSDRSRLPLIAKL